GLSLGRAPLRLLPMHLLGNASLCLSWNARSLRVVVSEGRFRESLHSELESDSFQIAEANPVPLGKPLPSLLIFCFHILLLQVFARLSIKRKEEERKL
ncbi:hypothetical protein, partial [Ornithobacterium rhinotracheale]|uniref:hypothetical protein n=1 Tax=Ornithobacterium rhinotracheale TaxID=28251 RepID=UPI0039FD3EC0